MFISRDLGVHVCMKCDQQLIDDNFVYFGTWLKGPNKMKPFIIYKCPHCDYDGQYILPLKEDVDLPGDIYRQYGNAIDAKYFREQDINPMSIDDFMNPNQ